MIGRYPHYQSLKERGEKFVTQKHYASDEIRKNLGNLETVWNDLNDNWEKRKLILTQLYDLQVGWRLLIDWLIDPYCNLV